MRPIETAHRLELVGSGGFWYLASPYTLHPDGWNKAYSDAMRASMALLWEGVINFCPIGYAHPMANAGLRRHDDAEFWMRLLRPFMEKSYGLIAVKMPGWRNSKGMQEEIDYFNSRNKTIFTLEWPIEEFKWNNLEEVV